MGSKFLQADIQELERSGEFATLVVSLPVLLNLKELTIRMIAVGTRVYKIVPLFSYRKKYIGVGDKHCIVMYS